MDTTTPIRDRVAQYLAEQQPQEGIVGKNCVATIADALDLKRPQVSNAVASLKASGLVDSNTSDDGGRRTVAIWLTSGGRAQFLPDTSEEEPDELATAAVRVGLDDVAEDESDGVELLVLGAQLTVVGMYLEEDGGVLYVLRDELGNEAHVVTAAT